MAGRRVHFVMSEELVARIDAALSEGQSRGEFVRRAVERALGMDGSAVRAASGAERRSGSSDAIRSDRLTTTDAVAPAEQLERSSRPPASGVDRTAMFRRVTQKR